MNDEWGQQVQKDPQYVQQVPQQPFVQLVVVLDLGAIREVVHELYGLGLIKIGHLGFYQHYTKMIGRENPYLRDYRIPDFSLFSRKDGQSTLKHVARFTVQCREVVNNENFYHFKLKLFPNSLIGTTFTWYTILPRNSIQSW